MTIEDDFIHQTDSSFQRYINQEFGINRGVYNTIDQWFFNQQWINVVERRTEILHFLHYAASLFGNTKNKIIFGNGQLVSYLMRYLESKEINTYRGHTMHTQTKTG